MDILTSILSANPETIRALMAPEMIRAESVQFSSMFFGIFSALILVAFFACLIDLIKPRKSEGYRKVICDMYVAGKVRQLASEDKIDLNEEYKKFQRFDRKSRLSEKDLDKTIEMDMKEEVSERIDNKINKDKAL